MSENGAEPHGNGESLRFSGEITEIAPALLAVQRAVTDPPREGTNPHFGSAYVRLEDLIHAVRPVLSEHEISLHQAPGMDAGMVTVETLLLHTSGEWVRCTARSPIQRDDPQGVGSAITYLRRYSLASILGLVHDADDDANRASPGRDESRPPKRQQQSSGAEAGGLSCPDCGGPVWDNTEDEKSAANGGKRPNFKCKDKECDWATWDSRAETFGYESDALPDDPGHVDPTTEAKKKLWTFFKDNYGSEAESKFSEFVVKCPGVPSNPSKLDPFHVKQMLDLLDEHGIEAAHDPKAFVGEQGELIA